jgi:hypothetical protein
MTQYTSIHSGVDIDRAVSYYKSIDSYGRSIINCPIQTSNWKSVSSATGTDKNKLTGVTSIYYIKISLSGVYKIGGAPIIYFVDNNGQKWEIDHIFDNDIVDPTPQTTQTVYCLSNTNTISGNIIVVGNLTDTTNKDNSEFGVTVTA